MPVPVLQHGRNVKSPTEQHGGEDAKDERIDLGGERHLRHGVICAEEHRKADGLLPDGVDHVPAIPRHGVALPADQHGREPRQDVPLPVRVTEPSRRVDDPALAHGLPQQQAGRIHGKPDIQHAITPRFRRLRLEGRAKKPLRAHPLAERNAFGRRVIVRHLPDLVSHGITELANLPFHPLEEEEIKNSSLLHRQCRDLKSRDLFAFRLHVLPHVPPCQSATPTV